MKVCTGVCVCTKTPTGACTHIYAGKAPAAGIALGETEQSHQALTRVGAPWQPQHWASHGPGPAQPPSMPNGQQGGALGVCVTHGEAREALGAISRGAVFTLNGGQVLSLAVP